jgi:hypothetical protein
MIDYERVMPTSTAKTLIGVDTAFYSDEPRVGTVYKEVHYRI